MFFLTLSFGVTTPYITPVQVDRLSLLTRSSELTSLQDPSFHQKNCKRAYQLRSGLWGLTTSHLTPVNQLSTVVILTVRYLQHICKVTVQSQKFWHHSWWLVLVCFFVFVTLCVFVFCFDFFGFFSRILGMGVEALIGKILGFLGGAGHYNLYWQE